MWHISINKIPIWSKETLKFQLPGQALSLNKQLIFLLLEKFQRKNPHVSDLYVGGSAALMLQDYIAKTQLSDVDIFCEGVGINEVSQIDVIKSDIFPPGWKERVIVINGYKVVSAFDVTCTMACCYMKPKISRRVVLMWMLREFNLDDIKQAIQAKLDSGIGVTESDFKSVEVFNKKVTQDLINRNLNPQKELIKILQNMENEER